MVEQSSVGPDWAQSWLRSERVAASVRVRIARRSGGRMIRLDPVSVGINDHLIVGRPDAQLGGGGLFVAWPGDASDRSLPRQAVRIELLLDVVRFTLAESFRGSRNRPPAVEVSIDGRPLSRAELQEPAHDAAASAAGDRSVLEIRRRTGDCESEVVTFEVEVQYAARAGERTLLAVDDGQVRAVEALSERWWPKVRATRSGAAFVAAAALAGTRPSKDAPLTPAERQTLLEAAGQPQDARLDRVLVTAVRSLFDAHRGSSPREWDGHLRALDVAHLYTDEPIEPSTDGAREYEDYGDPGAFLALARRLRSTGVLPSSLASDPPVR